MKDNSKCDAPSNNKNSISNYEREKKLRYHTHILRQNILFYDAQMSPHLKGSVFSHLEEPSQEDSLKRST